MQKIPQAVAMVLLMSALACPMCSGQTDAKNAGQAGGASSIMKTRGAVEVEALLREFLSKVNDPAMHQRFWADDVIYVGSSGAVRTKAEIMKNVTEESAKAKPQVGGSDGFSAEDVQVRQYGDVCVLNFRLVGTSEGRTNYYRNSGVFVQKNGAWQAVSWQATKEAELGVVNDTKK